MATKIKFLNSDYTLYDQKDFNIVNNVFFKPGVVFETDLSTSSKLAVAEKDTPDLGVKVGSGLAFVEITKNGQTFIAVSMIESETILSIAENESGVDRVDTIILRVSVSTEPSEDFDNITTIELVTGDGATALNDGEVQTAIGDDGFLRLADVTVGNGATQINNANIDDTRQRAGLPAGFTAGNSVILMNGNSSDLAGGDLVEGVMWYNSTDEKIQYYDGTSKIELKKTAQTIGDGLEETVNLHVDGTVVRTSGAQTLNGLKTFSTIPALPAQDATTNNQMIRKAQADELLIP